MSMSDISMVLRVADDSHVIRFIYPELLEFSFSLIRLILDFLRWRSTFRSFLALIYSGVTSVQGFGGASEFWTKRKNMQNVDEQSNAISSSVQIGEPGPFPPPWLRQC